MARPKLSTAERFWPMVDPYGPTQPHTPELGRCWEWIGCRDKNGYGKTRDADKSHIRTHRVSWILHNGPIPEGLWVLHRCDNPPCVRPDHLWLGTAKDNSEDMFKKGRAIIRPIRQPPVRAAQHYYRGDDHFSRSRPELLARGERNGSVRLTEAQVINIRARIAAGERRQPIADEHGIAITTISALVRRETWAHVP